MLPLLLNFDAVHKGDKLDQLRERDNFPTDFVRALIVRRGLN